MAKRATRRTVGRALAGAVAIAGSLTTALVATADLDATWSGDGQATTTARHTGAATFGDGTITAIGTSGNDAAVTRYSTTGAVLATATVTGSTPLEDTRGIVADGADTIVQFHTANGPALTRVDAAGAVVASFGGGDGWVNDTLGSCGSGDGQVADLALAPGGTIYTVAWNFLGNTPAECDGTAIRRYDSAGTRQSWGATQFEGSFVDHRLESMAIATDSAGNVYTAGVVFAASPAAEQVGVLKVDAAGNPVAAFGTNGLAAFEPGTKAEYFGFIGGFSRTAAARSAFDVAIDSAGRILLVGSGERASGGGQGIDAWVARLTPGGAPDPSFGTNGVTFVAINGSSADYGVRVAVDAADQVTITGVTNPAALGSSDSSGDEFTARLSSTGGLLGITFGTAGASRPASIALAGTRTFTAGDHPGGGGYVNAYTASNAPATVPTVTPTLPPTSVVPGPALPGPALFTGITPWRAHDSRQGAGVLHALSPRSIIVAGSNGVPTDAVAVALNVTVVDPSAGGYLTVYPSGTAAPNASTLNVNAGQTVANALVVGVGTGGQVDVVVGAGTAQVVVDVMGWFAAGQGFVAATPVRAIDTRATVALGPNETRTVTVAGLAGAPGPGAASAVALNITAVAPTAGGHLRAWAGAGAAPYASVVNFSPGQTVANAMVLGVDGDGRITVGNFSNGTVHLVIDVAGTFTTGAPFHPVTPVRAHDSRASSALDPFAVRAVTVTGVGEVPTTGVRGVIVNITVTEPTGAGYFTVFPGGSAQPLASLLNFTPRATVANAVVMGVGADGSIELANSDGTTQVVVDVLGWF